MTIRTTKLAIAIALISPMAVATSNQALAVSVPGGSVAVKAAAPTAPAKVKYRHHTVRHYQNYAPGDSLSNDNKHWVPAAPDTFKESNPYSWTHI